MERGMTMSSPSEWLPSAEMMNFLRRAGNFDKKLKNKYLVLRQIYGESGFGLMPGTPEYLDAHNLLSAFMHSHKGGLVDQYFMALHMHAVSLSLYDPQSEIDSAESCLTAMLDKAEKKGLDFVPGLSQKVHSFDPEEYLEYLDLLMDILENCMKVPARFCPEGAGYDRSSYLIYISEEKKMDYSEYPEAELSYFQYWKENFRKNILMPLHPNLLLLYMREVYLGIGISSWQEGLDLLRRLRQVFYRNGEVDSRLELLLPVYALRHDLPLEVSDIGSIDAVWNSSVRLNLWCERLMARPGRPVVPAFLLLRMLDFDFRKGTAWNHGQEKLIDLLDEALLFLDEKCRTQAPAKKARKKQNRKEKKPEGLFERFCPAVNYQGKMHSLLMDVPPVFFEGLEPVLNVYSSTKLPVFLTELAGSVDNLYRSLHHLRGARRTVLTKEPWVSWFKEFEALQQQKQEAALLQEIESHLLPPEPVELHLDAERISRLREESNQVREALNTENEEQKLDAVTLQHWLNRLSPKQAGLLYALAAHDQSYLDTVSKEAEELLQTMQQELLAICPVSFYTENAVPDSPGTVWNGFAFQEDILELVRQDASFARWQKLQESRKAQAAADSGTEETELSVLLQTLSEEEKRTLDYILAGDPEGLEQFLEEQGLFADLVLDTINGAFLDAGLELLIETDSGQPEISADYNTEVLKALL